MTKGKRGEPLEISLTLILVHELCGRKDARSWGSLSRKALNLSTK